MTDEKVLLEALSSTDFKVSVREKNQTDALETEAAAETKKQFRENLAISADKNTGAQSLLSKVKDMSASQRQKVIDSLKQNGLGDPLTKEKLIQNAFTVEKTIQDNVSS